MLSRLSSAHVISMIALFVALGGGAYAASLPRNSVGSAQLKPNAVTAAKVKDGSLRRADFAAGELPSVQGTVRGETGPAGPAGPQGPKGDTGAAGATGPQGPRGFAGDTGPAGKDGATGSAGKDGANGADGLGLGGFFGNGADGDTTIDANTTLQRDMYFDDLTVGNAQLNTNGFRLFVAGTLTLNQNARIHRNGNPGSSGAGGGALVERALGGGGSGGANTPIPCFPATSTTNALGGRGGVATCSGFGNATVPDAAVGGPQVLSSATSAITGRTLDGAVINGGGGGSAATSGGAGGGGGAGVVVVVARRIVVAGTTATISANGGQAGSGAAGGGGGGVVVVVSTSARPAALALTATGGTSSTQAFNGVAGTTVYLN